MNAWAKLTLRRIHTSGSAATATKKAKGTMSHGQILPAAPLQRPRKLCTSQKLPSTITITPDQLCVNSA